ncbi:hypothetical protein F2Q69_00035540 [Brassica cretica]|uniref:ABC transporter domain-containing protein n=1 Tax=Brassica cretica TaxID=69181 RepID=A0A8S9SFR1_BRACR|nr:hypothetical protein F2Q69_00035540 [Brassica cretica]
MIPFYLCVVLVGIQALFDSQNIRLVIKESFVPSQIHNHGLAPLVLIPLPRYSVADANLTDVSCRQRNNCPVTILLTGTNQSLGATLSRNLLLRRSFVTNYSDLLFSLAENVLATTYKGSATNYLDAGIVSDRFIYNLQPRCTQKSNFSFSVGQPPLNFTKEILFKWIDYVLILRKQEIRCVQGLNLWRNSSREVNSEIFRGYQKGNPEGKINEIVAAYDLLDTNKTNFNVNIWYNATYLEDSGNRPPKLLRVPRLVSLVILTTLVYEKQQRLRIIMKMHGLGDGPYWMISYAYCLAISTVCLICLMIFGAAIASSAFSKVETASVVGYIYVFGSGLLGWFLFQFLIEDLSYPRHWIFVMELYPGFSLFRGLYEFSHYAFQGNLTGRNGMKWKDLSESSMDKVFYIIIVEWFFLLITAYYIDKMSSSGKGLLFFLKKPFEKFLSPQRPCLQNQVSTVAVEMEKLDVIQESEKVEKLMLEQSISHTIVCNKMNKEYPGRDGNPPKMAVRGLSFAVPSGECFGMLGPNGAGKTNLIHQHDDWACETDIRVSVCTRFGHMHGYGQSIHKHGLLWETLSGREHLLFYGRLKNLKDSDLDQAVEESLKSVNLLRGGVSDNPAGKYSGGHDPASRMNLWTVIKRAKTNSAIILTTHSM